MRHCVRAAVGDPIDEIHQPVYEGYWVEIILHSERDGVFRSIEIDKTVEERFLIEKDIWVKAGYKVQGFTGANTTIGTLVLRFDTNEEMTCCLSNQERWLKIIVL